MQVIFQFFVEITCKDNVYLCQNGGTCQNTSQNNSVIGYKCKCPVGYYGFLCELSKSLLVLNFRY